MFTKWVLAIATIGFSWSAMASVTAICTGNKSAFRAYVVKNKGNQNTPLEIIIRQGRSGKGKVMFRAPMSINPNSYLNNSETKFDYIIQADTGFSEVLKIAGRFYSSRGQSYSTKKVKAVALYVTRLQLAAKGIKINESVHCRYRGQKAAKPVPMPNPVPRVVCPAANGYIVSFYPSYGEVHFDSTVNGPSWHDDGLDFRTKKLMVYPSREQTSIVDDEGNFVGGWSKLAGKGLSVVTYKGQKYSRCVEK